MYKAPTGKCGNAVVNTDIITFMDGKLAVEVPLKLHRKCFSF